VGRRSKRKEERKECPLLDQILVSVNYQDNVSETEEGTENFENYCSRYIV